jgi:hypothetical protein
MRDSAGVGRCRKVAWAFYFYNTPSACDRGFADLKGHFAAWELPTVEYS